ncbi:heme-dependent catalase [Aspergillus sclerotioniger CBS 115572]|uniref:Heme-dependent catalase n=1 Tax=Aspergillus sclerotioniger CBS 115572 TaxID=1450535 RepID=A0A317W5F7_9EURO|nr:heme-dependent catalase [Aspergillus sclerotioniger CBS 115572]PWY80831.1 heme-dependent catalase [Aspergillus sclerotioniger CBS 115572]
MPLPTDSAVVETSQGLVDVLHGIFGAHPGQRPAHAKGILLQGTFQPTPEAALLSAAPHFHQSSTPILARFSSSTGIPNLPDTDPNGNPRGLALRFILEESPRHVHTDIISHSTPFFPAKDGPEVLAFFRALASGTIESFLSTHPAAQAFIQAEKPFPASFSTEKYFGVNAFKFIANDGSETFIRYRIIPVAGASYLDDEQIKAKSDTYLYDELSARLSTGPVAFDLVAQLAEDGDVTDDCTVHWPDDRILVKLGRVLLESIMEDNAAEQKRIIFDPVPRVKGIEPSEDQLIETRAGVYLISGRERRAA